MTEFKEKINEVLKTLNYSFDDLAGHLGMNSEQLNQAIDDKKVELRTLEFISKELRIPLYSFFRNEDFVPVNNLPEEPFYINKINKNTIDQLQIENILLRKEVENLKEQLIKCEKKMKAFL
jgi:transcriptional regulator with XRE-family HTH domain